MDLYVVTVLRLVHILGGIFWVGTAMLFIGFIEPAVKAMGPEGGKFMQRLAQTRLFVLIPVAAGLTTLSGLALYWWASGGLQLGWIASTRGLVFTLSSLAGVLAAVVGAAVSMPTEQRMETLGREMAMAGGPPTAAQIERMEALQARGARAGMIGFALLIASAVGMSIARYLW
jgi:hypothetical protein